MTKPLETPSELDRALDHIQATQFINEDTGETQLATIGHDRAKAAIEPLLAEEKLRSEVLQLTATKVAYEQYSHEATPFYKVMIEALEHKKQRLATLRTELSKKEKQL